MEPCTMPSFGGKPASQCGCAQTTVPVEVPVGDRSYESVAFAPAPEGVSLMVPLIAFAFAAFVFARQRRPSTIVQLHLARPRVRPERAPRRFPRLELSERERRAFARLGEWRRRLRGVTRGQMRAPAAPAVVYSHPRLRNRHPGP